MIPLEALRDLYDYNYWARDRQLQACYRLNEGRMKRFARVAIADQPDSNSSSILEH